MLFRLLYFYYSFIVISEYSFMKMVFIIKSNHQKSLEQNLPFKMDFIKGLGKIFKGEKGSEQIVRNPQSKLKGKMVKDYVFQNQIVQFQKPQTELVSGMKQVLVRVSIYALEKSILNQQTFIAYQNSLANNYGGIYPQYLEHVQSSNFIYIILQQLAVPQSVSWMVEDFLNEIQQFSLKVKEKLELKGLLINGKKKLLYLPPYQDLRYKTKLYYEGINKTVFAELFCKVFELPQTSRQKIYDKIVEYAETNQLKSEVLKLFVLIEEQEPKNNKSHNKNQNHPMPSSQNPFNKNKFPQQNNTQPNQFIQPSQMLQDSLYPDISAEDEQIMKLLSVVKVNPKLFQSDDLSTLRASTRARHQNQEETQQIKEVIDSVKKSLFEINKVVKKSSMKSTFDNKNEKQVSNNKFEVYCTTYISIFRHFKRTVKSTLQFYSEGFSGIINAYFITLIGIFRRLKLVSALSYEGDVFQIGCENANVQFYTGKLKKELVSQAKILTDLREMIFRCYIPINTLEILGPFLDDHIQNIDPIKLEDFTFFYMTSLMKNNFQEDVHFVNLIECMYIILHRNFEIVHFESDFPKKWDDEFFNLRMCLIKSMVPGWKI